MTIKPINILGLMSGTSLEGFQATLTSTDGIDLYENLGRKQILFSDELREKIRRILGKKNTNPADAALIEEVENETTDFIVQTIKNFAEENPNRIDAIGLEGPSICHEPQNGYTYQLGKGRMIAARTGFKVITHFHNADILNGGQGAPITAAYYNALAQNLAKPIVFINIGGITNITWIGHYGEICAFDCGPGNALIDDWMLKHAGIIMDYDGKMAATGQVDEKIVGQLLKSPYLAKYPPKSADRGDFKDKSEHLEGLSAEDGAATATAFISEAIAYALALYLPELPSLAVICGGGSKNPTLVRFIRQKLRAMRIDSLTADDMGLDIDGGQAVAFLAARRLYGLPITFPGTTGVAMPMTGGEIYEKE